MMLNGVKTMLKQQNESVAKLNQNRQNTTKVTKPIETGCFSNNKTNQAVKLFVFPCLALNSFPLETPLFTKRIVAIFPARAAQR